MKISPIPVGQGGMSTPGTSLTVDSNRTRAVSPPVAAIDPQLEASRDALRSRTIKMRVNRTPGPRDYQNPEAEETEETATAEVENQGSESEVPAITQAIENAAASAQGAPAPEATPADAETPTATEERPLGSTSEQANATAEETKPLSPQFAALARQRRALQVKERELATREKSSQEAVQKAVAEAVAAERARLKSQPLSVLQEAQVTYDELTEAILSGKDTNPELFKLREEIKALKEGFDKTLSDRDAQAEADAFAEMNREANSLAYTGDDFELVRETKAIPKVMDLIKRVWKEEKEILPVHEAMRLVEDELVSQTVRVAALKKVQGRLAPKAPAPPSQTAPAAQKPVIKTLTNRDTTTAPLSRKERAMQAFYGKK